LPDSDFWNEQVRCTLRRYLYPGSVLLDIVNDPFCPLDLLAHQIHVALIGDKGRIVIRRGSRLELEVTGRIDLCHLGSVEDPVGASIRIKGPDIEVYGDVHYLANGSHLRKGQV